MRSSHVVLAEAHLERVKPLVVSKRQRGQWLLPEQRKIAARLGRTIDGLAIPVMERVFIASHRKNRHQQLVASTVQGPWAGHAERAYANRASFFWAPTQQVHVNTVRKENLPGGWIEDISFPSYHAPHRDTAVFFTREYPENTRAHIRHYRHQAPGHPAVICLHGWGGGYYALESRIFRAQWLYNMGFDVYIYTHPYHGPRRPKKVRIGAALHPSTNIARTNEAFLQTAWELRILLSRHREMTGAEGGIIGMSLGGYVTAMMASLDESLAFAVPIMPIADLSALVWAWGEKTKDRKEAENSGVTFESFCQLMSVHAPLAHPLKLAKERVLIIAGHGDNIVPPSHTRALWEHWDKPQLHWFSGGHLMHIGRDGYFRALKEFLLPFTQS